ncbi:SUMF1/EgtB/PvdO family nonheme iron enzyme [Anabaena sp. FACHB-1391]|uniref:SUMF1/EgtB/PvdO family nonheme iron enzyme n=1 Tax=Anabaena sp. FACHB-1391 TaxID=2692771 RepID=UPI0016814175|nr:SUMF1/EgtB/PvdO family nonheme iron enzyme [Anabaena sp. FACHB-1391]MBD2269158.1 SUMF1/EgtB/PvdO family nonheme iron enzyme [Anabaena sp. FACHB-1391]
MDWHQHIKEQLEKERQLLKEYEDRKRNENDPRLLNRWETNIQSIKLEIKKHQEELNKLPITSPNSSSNQSFSQDLGLGVKLEMVYIPGDTFLMGAPKTEEKSLDDERPQHYVEVKPFYMGKYTITQEQWEKVVYSCPPVARELNPRPAYFQGDKLPVEQVSWHDAVEFCARLSQKTGQKYRLPSEAEWEYACRAGSAKPFAFGDTITTDMVNYDGNFTYGNASKGEYRGRTTPVGTFQPNAFGLCDMHGNVWEWCADTWHGNYHGAPNDGSAWISKTNQNARLLRGGSWNSNPGLCRSASRLYNILGYYYGSIGFRVVCSGAART